MKQSTQSRADVTAPSDKRKTSESLKKQQTEDTQSPEQPPDAPYFPPDVLTAIAYPIETIDLEGEPPVDSGRFTITLWIDAEGRVTRADLEESDAPQSFTSRILDQFTQSHFVPGRIGELPVASILRVEVTY